MRFLLILLASVALQAAARELPLPTVPSTLTTPADRASYVARHFWDGMEWADSAAVADGEFMGRNIATFATILPLVSDSIAAEAAAAMVAGADTSAVARRTLPLLVEDYLLARRSPVRSDAVYITLARAMARAGWPGKERMLWLADMVALNAPGTPAPDFSFILRDGREVTLRSMLDGRPTLLLFYSPTCHDCSELIGQMQRVAEIASGEWQVIAVDPGGDRDEWDRSTKIPSAWTDGYEHGRIEDDEIYFLPQLPTAFLISPSGTIEAKEWEP